MTNLIKGQKVKLDSFSSLDFQVEIQLNFKKNVDYDVCCFGVDSNNQLSDDRYFIFYNQAVSPRYEIQKVKSDKGSHLFNIFLGKLPDTINKLVFTASIDGNFKMSDIDNGFIRFISSNNEVMIYNFNQSDFSSEKAIILGEFYLKNIWRFAAVGQGFNGGLSTLLKHFGGEEIQEPEPQKTKPPAQDTPKINLGKITLEKRGDSQKVNLTKKNNEEEPIHINLNWTQTIRKTKLFGSKKLKADLDLGCFIFMKDGRKGVIQALGNNFGSKVHPPYIYLDEDDRSGLSEDGENIYIMRPSLIEKVLIFSFIYEGNASFKDVNAYVTIKDINKNEIQIKLNNPSDYLTFCAVSTIVSTEKGLEITKEEKYFEHHEKADNHYGFGFRWKAGSK